LHTDSADFSSVVRQCRLPPHARLVCIRYSSWVPLYDSLSAAFGGCIFSGWAATGSQHFDSLRDAPRLHGACGRTGIVPVSAKCRFIEQFTKLHTTLSS